MRRIVLFLTAVLLASGAVASQLLTLGIGTASTPVPIVTTYIGESRGSGASRGNFTFGGAGLAVVTFYNTGAASAGQFTSATLNGNAMTIDAASPSVTGARAAIAHLRLVAGGTFNVTPAITGTAGVTWAACVWLITGTMVSDTPTSTNTGPGTGTVTTFANGLTLPSGGVAIMGTGKSSTSAVSWSDGATIDIDDEAGSPTVGYTCAHDSAAPIGDPSWTGAVSANIAGGTWN